MRFVQCCSERRRRRCFPESVVLLICFEHTRAGKCYGLLVGKKRKSSLHFPSIAFQLLDWLDFVFLRVRAIFVWGDHVVHSDGG